MRINRFLAAAGLGSRRGVEELVRSGQVTVNGQVCTDLAARISDADAVKVRGRLIRAERPIYVLLNKPRGYTTTAADPHAPKTIFELIPANWPRLFHVGRLDRDSEGLLILTNDGDLALRLTHPRFHIEKEYEVLIDKPIEIADRDKLLHGIHIEGGRARAVKVQRIAPTHLRVVLKQGLKRQIRQMFFRVGYEVERLVRVRIGPIRIERMRPGEWRFLTPREIELLSKPAPAPRPTQPAKSVRASKPARSSKPARPGKPARASKPARP